MADRDVLLVDARAGFEEQVEERLADLEAVERVEALDRSGNLDHAIVVAGGESVVKDLLVNDLQLTPGVDDARRADPDDPVVGELLD